MTSQPTPPGAPTQAPAEPATHVTNPGHAEIVLIAAVARNGVIGAAGGMPWRLPEDLRRFKSLTMGKAVVMGRRTYDSIGRPLPGRRVIVITSDPQWHADGVQAAGSLTEALALAGPGEVMVAGGGQVYAQALPLADRLELTHVNAEPDGDTRFPEYDETRWHEVSRDVRDSCVFATYRRRVGS